MPLILVTPDLLQEVKMFFVKEADLTLMWGNVLNGFRLVSIMYTRHTSVSEITAGASQQKVWSLQKDSDVQSFNKCRLLLFMVILQTFYIFYFIHVLLFF